MSEEILPLSFGDREAMAVIAAKLESLLQGKRVHVENNGIVSIEICRSARAIDTRVDAQIYSVFIHTRNFSQQIVISPETPAQFSFTDGSVVIEHTGRSGTKFTTVFTLAKL